MALPQLVLARQAVALLAVAKQVHAQMAALSPEDRAAVASDLERVRRLTTALSSRGLTRFRGNKLSGWSADGPSPESGTAMLDEAEIEELKRLLSRLTAYAAGHVERAAEHKTGRGLKGKAATHGVRIVASQTQKRLAAYGAGAPDPAARPLDPVPTREPSPQSSALSDWLRAWVGGLDPASAAGMDGQRNAAASAFLLIRHGFVPHARAAGALEFADIADGLVASTAIESLDEVYVAFGESLARARAARTGRPVETCRAEAHEATSTVVAEWSQRHIELLRVAASHREATSIEMDRVREQVETLLAYELDLEAELNGDVSFRHGSACMYIGVDEWEGHAVVRLTMPLLLGAERTPELMRRVAEEGTYRFGHLVVLPAGENVDVHFVHAVLGDHLDAPELRLVVQLMASVGDELDDELAERFGSGRFQRGSGATAPSPV